MLQPLASSAPAINAHSFDNALSHESEISYENEIFGEYERFLDEAKKPDSPSRSDETGRSGHGRTYALILVAVCGAAFALAQVDVKEKLLTGRSVAFTTGR